MCVQVDERFFYFFESGDDRLPILLLGNLGLRLRRLYASLDRRIEHREVDARQETQGEAFEQIGQPETRSARPPAKADRRQLSEPCLSYQVICLEHSILGSDHLRPAREQLGRQTSRDYGKLDSVLQARRWN